MNQRKSNKITIAIVVLVTLALIAAVVVAIVSKGDQVFAPPESTVVTKDDQEETTAPDTVEPIRPNETTESKDNTVGIDVSVIGRNSEPVAVSGEIEYETKDGDIGE